MAPIDATHGRLRWPCRPDERSEGRGQRSEISPRDSALGTRHFAFTVVELLIVIAIIIVLMGLLLVAMNAATRTAQRTNTAALMNSITTGLVRFKDDLGYYPPVLGPLNGGAVSNPDLYRKFSPPPDPTLAGFDGPSGLAQQWWSITSLAEYLLGYASACDPSALGVSHPLRLEDGADGLGIRNPGPDGVWGESVNGLRDACNHLPSGTSVRPGKVYGPYLEVKDPQLLASIDGTVDASGNLKVFLPGAGGYNANAPKVICDYWGQPIRYYRQVYRQGSPSSQWRDPTGQTPSPDLGNVFVLRPWNFKTGEDIIGKSDGNTACVHIPGMPVGDPFTTYSLKTAQFALFSSGVDKRLQQEVRRDDCPPDGKQFNADNLVLEGGS